MHPSTFSMVAYDAERGEWGVATQSKFLAVGALVPWARAGAGAIATQANANTGFGPRGIELLAAGLPAHETLMRLLAGDPGREQRQVGIVDATGGAATFTGSACMAWAGGVSGPGFACQGNILAGEPTVQALAETFVRSSGPLSDRLVNALAAGQAAGGDRRGQQSAALLVVRASGGYGGFNDRAIDLRVDDDRRPIKRLQELLALHHLYFDRPAAATLVPIDARLARELQRLLIRAGYLPGKATGVYDRATRQALERLFGIENLEERWQKGKGIDPVALEYLRKHYPARTSSKR